MPRGYADYRQHVQAREKEPPKILYKYTSADVARQILSTVQLRFQSPLRYNDPFDSQWDIAWPLYTAEAKEYERRLVEDALRNPDSWPRDADPDHRLAMDSERDRIASLPEEERDSAIRAFVDAAAGIPEELPEPVARRFLDIRRRMRVCCFSESDDSLLLWSHYADEHRGVVLGFDASVLEGGFRRPLESVKYCPHPPPVIDHTAWIRTLVLGTPFPKVESLDDLALTKHTDWAYEREWRFVWSAARSALGNMEDVPFLRDALVELVLGCRADSTLSQELLGLALGINPTIRQHRMEIHRTRFELVKREFDTQSGAAVPPSNRQS